MELFAVDYETYWAKDYTLRKMTPIEYVLDPRYETIGCAVLNTKGKGFWLDPGEMQAFCDARRGKPTAFVSHNALFDMVVCKTKFDYVPDLMIDTLGMARAMLRKTLRSCSLANIAEYMGLEAKGTTVLTVQGMTRQMIINAGLMEQYGAYSLKDARLCMQIFMNLMADGFPEEELRTMDQVVRMAVEPKFKLDLHLLSQYLHEVTEAKKTLLDRCGLSSPEHLMSNDKFAAALEELGVDPPLKWSDAQQKRTWAFAKSDTDFMDLQEHEDPDVQALMAARLGHKSTIEETRCQRFFNIAQLPWPDGSTGWMPIPLKYSGAHTHRLSGDWKLNCQNLGRKSRLRQAFIVPPGYKVVDGDSSQIECRMVGGVARQWDLLEQFRNGEDVYCTFGSDIFGFPVIKGVHKDERFISKTGVLGLGFGVGPVKFRSEVKVKSEQELGKRVDIGMELASRVVSGYRTKYMWVKSKWRDYDEYLIKMQEMDCLIQDGPVTFMHNKVVLPNGACLYYEQLQREESGEWKYWYGGMWKHIYGAKMFENVIQALARIVTMGAARRITKITGFDLAIQVHDALGYVVHENDAAALEKVMREEMCVSPDWMPFLPLAVEVGIGDSYGTVEKH